MPSPTTVAAFAGASLLLILFPGPAMLFLVARGVSGGRRVGVMSAIGLVFDASYGALAGTISSRLRRRRGKSSAKGKIATGLTYIGLGGFTAATESRTR